MEDQDSRTTHEGQVYLWQGYQNSSSPTCPPTLSDQAITRVSIGAAHTAYLTRDHQVYCHGKNDYGQLGVGNPGEECKDPVLVQSLKDVCVTDIACGSYHTAAITDSGDIYCWGRSDQGQCGLGSLEMVPSPTLVEIYTAGHTCVHGVVGKRQKVVLTQVACGETHTVAVSDQAEVWVWGSGCQLGLNKVTQAMTPQKLDFLHGKQVLQVVCGVDFSAAILQKTQKSETNKSKSAPSSPHMLQSVIQTNIDSPKTCTLCEKEIYSYTEEEDICIISDDHRCPLGLDLSADHSQCEEKRESHENHLIHDEGDNHRKRELKNNHTEVEQTLGNSVMNNDEIELKHAVAIKPTEVVTSPAAQNSDSSSEIHHGQATVTEPSTCDTHITKDVTSASKDNLELRQKDDSGENIQKSRGHSFLNDEGKALDFLTRTLSGEQVAVESDPCHPNLKDKKSLPDESKDSINAQGNFFQNLTSAVVDNFKSTVDHFGFVSRTYDVEGSDSASIDSLYASSDTSGKSPVQTKKTSVPSENETSFMTLPRTALISKTHHGSKVPKSQSFHDFSPRSREGATPKSTSAQQLGRGTKAMRTNKSGPHQSSVCLNTEVWTWGKGGVGQLGHGDHLDRLQPCCITSMSNKRIVKLSAGSHHIVAVTSSGQVYTWGCNASGQLGRTGNEDAPTKVKLMSNVCLWDGEAGGDHSLLLADSGLGFQPDIYFCGKRQGVQETKERALQPIRLTQIKKLGWLRQISSGFQMSACIVDRNSTGFTATLHELAVSERAYYHQCLILSSNILRPIFNSDQYKKIDPAFSLTLEMLFEAFCNITDNIGVNSVELTRAVQGFIPVQDVFLIKSHDEFLALYQYYSRCFGDCLAVGGFDCLNKNVGPFFKSIQDVLQQLVELTKVQKASSDVKTFRKLLQLPLRRLKEYERLTQKIAMGFEEDHEIRQHLLDVSSSWDKLKQNATADHKLAENTRLFWEACPQKFSDSLRSPNRRLLKESRHSPLSVPNAGRFSSHWLLLFNDTFVHVQYSSHQAFPLATLWIEPQQDTDTVQNAILLTMPEETLVVCAPSGTEKSEWLFAINQAIDAIVSDKKPGLSQDVRRSSLGFSMITPPQARHASHVFYKAGPFKEAKYTGMWLKGKMHGQGELVWPDDQKYVGKFKQGLQHGQGVHTIPKTGGLDEIQEGNWREGKLHGLGSIRYANGDVYEGYFQNGLRHGHGILKHGKHTSTAASIYIGEWVNDKRQGYGVLDDIVKGEKYMGMWENDQRHGNGIIVTLDGMYFEGNFVQNRMMGFGLMQTEDNTSYEGDFYGITQLSGKGTMTMPNGDTIVGTFTGSLNDGIKVNGTFHKLNQADGVERRGFTHTLGLLPGTYSKLSVPADRKWGDIFRHCHLLLGQQSDKPVDSKKAWDVVAVMVSAGGRALKSSTGNRARSESQELLEKIPPYNKGTLTIEYYHDICSYLSKAFNTSYHPLGKLMEGLVDVYRATYVGVGAHPRLRYHAIEEVRSFINRIYHVVRILFPDLPVDGSTVLHIYHEEVEHNAEDPLGIEGIEEEEECEAVSAACLLHPLLLPKIYPPLFTLYALYNEKEDEKYWDRLTRYNKQPDLALMSYLGVDQKFWLIDTSDFLQAKQKLSSLKDYCYLEAVEMLQQISTSFSPADKLQIIQKTFDEINKTVQTSIGQDHLWCMDDLFPVFQYVVARARIRHLGAEIHFIDDLMESHLEHGELGIMFTTLKACYFQIQHEKLAS